MRVIKMKKTKEYSLVYTIGAVGYSAIELLWRGWTHWSMALTGGACFLGFHIMNAHYAKERLFTRCLRGCTIITAIEFCVGCVVNLGLNMQVWDYSKMRGNLFGQVCPIYTILWFFLCIPMNYLSHGLKKLSLRK